MVAMGLQAMVAMGLRAMADMAAATAILVMDQVRTEAVHYTTQVEATEAATVMAPAMALATALMAVEAIIPTPTGRNSREYAF